MHAVNRLLLVMCALSASGCGAKETKPLRFQVRSSGVFLDTAMTPEARRDAARRIAAHLVAVQQTGCVPAAPPDCARRVRRFVQTQAQHELRLAQIAAASYLLSATAASTGPYPSDPDLAAYGLALFDSARVVDLALFPSALLAVQDTLPPEQRMRLVQRVLDADARLPKYAYPRQQRLRDSLVALVRPLAQMP